MRYLLPVLVLCAACDSPSPADLILYNGNIITLDPDAPRAEAVAITGERVVALGTSDELRGTEAATRIDLDGRTVVPGLTDNHYHSIGGGPGVNLASARSLDDVIDAIAQRASDSPNGTVVVTNSDWHEGQLAEGRLPFRDDLDRASTAHPLVVVRGGHEYILNSNALEKWGIDTTTETPDGGRIGRYPDGRLNGELVDTAKRFVDLPEPAAPEGDPDERLLAEFRALNRVGLTSIRYGSASPDLFHRLQVLRDDGRLPLRVSALLRLPRGTAGDAVAETLASWNIDPEDRDEWLAVAGIKLGVDGGFEGGLMRDAYEEPWGRDGTFVGLQTMPTDHFKAVVRALNGTNFRVGTHAVGDAAIDLVLDAYELANEDASIVGKRWAIEHGFIPRDDQLLRMRALGLHVTAQHHLYLAAPSLVKYWGRDRAEWVTPLKAYLDAGVPVSLGTDSPVVPHPPLWVLYHFITRDTMSAGVMGADQRVTREQALRAMTMGYAELDMAEAYKGTLAPGFVADLVVLEDDLLSCEPERIRDMNVLMTVVGGDIVFRHESW